MPARFDPRSDILPESQLRLWPELEAVPSDFILYGGTGLALQLGHRASEDFDFSRRLVLTRIVCGRSCLFFAI
jgi:hypothetical protein